MRVQPLHHALAVSQPQVTPVLLLCFELRHWVHQVLPLFLPLYRRRYIFLIMIAEHELQQFHAFAFVHCGLQTDLVIEGDHLQLQTHPPYVSAHVFPPVLGRFSLLFHSNDEIWAGVVVLPDVYDCGRLDLFGDLGQIDVEFKLMETLDIILALHEAFIKVTLAQSVADTGLFAGGLQSDWSL